MKPFFLFLLSVFALTAGDSGGKAEYVGGTRQDIKSGTGGRIVTSETVSLWFLAGSRGVELPFKRINLLEYGQKVDRRVLMAVAISPLLLMSKSRKHFLTVGYEDESGAQHAMVFRVDKKDVRAVLASLEARTGLRVTFQDEEARKAGKG